jgi:hypothetical protein
MKGADADADDAPAITIGPDSMIRATDSGADLKIVEHTGKAIESGRQDLQDCEARMAHLSVEVLFQAPKSQTSATESSHDAGAEDCKLGSAIKALEAGLSTAIGFAMEYERGELPKGKLVTINTEFGIEPQDAADLQTLYQSRMAGQISHLTYLKELKRRKVLAPDTDATTELANAKADGPVNIPSKDNTPSTMGNDPNSMSQKGGAGA